MVLCASGFSLVLSLLLCRLAFPYEMDFSMVNIHTHFHLWFVFRSCFGCNFFTIKFLPITYFCICHSVALLCCVFELVVIFIKSQYKWKMEYLHKNNYIRVVWLVVVIVIVIVVVYCSLSREMRRASELNVHQHSMSRITECDKYTHHHIQKLE